MFRGCEYDVLWRIKPATPRGSAGYCGLFHGVSGGQKAFRSFCVASKHFDKHLWTSLKKSSEEQGRVEVKFLTLKYLYKIF
jgi:hypothetical protein